jgi:hypothetical protein
MIIMLVLLLSLAATGRVHGEVPSAADVAACNQLAPQAIKTGSASPIMGDHARARERARPGHDDELHGRHEQGHRVVRSANPRDGRERSQERRVSGRLS